MSAEILPTVLGIALVAAAAAFALVPFARGVGGDAVATPSAAIPDRFVIYRQVLELEFDYHLGKLSAEDLASQSAELLSQAGAALRDELGQRTEVDAEIEREILAARAAFAAARHSSAVGISGRLGDREAEAPSPS